MMENRSATKCFGLPTFFSRDNVPKISYEDSSVTKSSCENSVVSSEQDDDGGLIPGLTADVALSCMAILPTPLRMHLRIVCRKWRDECCGESINQTRFSSGLLMDASYLCNCPIKEMPQSGKGLKLKSGSNCSVRQKIMAAYCKKFQPSRNSKSSTVPLDLENVEQSILACEAKLKKHLCSTNLSTASIDDVAMFKLEMDRHKEVAASLRSLMDPSRIPEPPSWKSLLKFPNSGVLNNDAIVFFMMA